MSRVQWRACCSMQGYSDSFACPEGADTCPQLNACCMQCSEGLPEGAPLHGKLDAPQELPCPHDVARHWWCIAHQRWAVLVGLIELLLFLKIVTIVLEDDLVLCSQVLLQLRGVALLCGMAQSRSC